MITSKSYFIPLRPSEGNTNILKMVSAIIFTGIKKGKKICEVRERESGDNLWRTEHLNSIFVSSTSKCLLSTYCMSSAFLWKDKDRWWYRNNTSRSKVIKERTSLRNRSNMSQESEEESQNIKLESSFGVDNWGQWKSRLGFGGWQRAVVTHWELLNTMGNCNIIWAIL